VKDTATQKARENKSEAPVTSKDPAPTNRALSDVVFDTGFGQGRNVLRPLTDDNGEDNTGASSGQVVDVWCNKKSKLDMLTATTFVFCDRMAIRNDALPERWTFGCHGAPEDTPRGRC
jgi:hypothetical protein